MTFQFIHIKSVKFTDIYNIHSYLFRFTGLFSFIALKNEVFKTNVMALFQNQTNEIYENYRCPSSWLNLYHRSYSNETGLSRSWNCRWCHSFYHCSCFSWEWKRRGRRRRRVWISHRCPRHGHSGHWYPNRGSFRPRRWKINYWASQVIRTRRRSVWSLLVS